MLSNRLVLALAVCLFLPWPSLAGTLLVSNTNDSGAGSLRQAVVDNNTVGGGNTIVFSNVVTGTVTLTGGELLISSNVTILGPGPASLRVNGNAAGRVFHITNAANAAISGLTITNGAVSGSYPGNTGGGIWNDHSTLTLSNCAITGNYGGNGTGGGIFNDGSSGNAKLSIVASTVSANRATSGGGGVWNLGAGGTATLSVSASTFSGNDAGANAGGGIFNNVSSGTGTISVSNSTFVGNVAGVGGGIANVATSGTGVVTVVASTFSTNSAGSFGGGIGNNGGTTGNAVLTVIASTFSGNSAALSGGGSIYNTFLGAKLEVADTILQAGAQGGNFVNNGSVTSDGFNLSSDNAQGLLNNATDQINTDPKLAPLADNGGPTFTHALTAGSPAIDKGKSFGLATDQRGAPRLFDFASLTNATGGDGSDIGAFELNPVASPPDGTIVYCRHNGTNDSTTVWFANPLQGYDFLVTTGWMARISLDRRYLVFLRDSSNGSAYGSRGDLWVRDLLSGTETNLYHDTDYITAADFTRDETRIMLDFGCADWSIDRDGSSLGYLTNLSGGSCYDDAPAVNPVDGRIVYHNNGGGGGIALADTNFQNKVLIPNAALGTYALWSHDGQWISFTLTSAYYTYAGYNLYKIKPDGSGRTPLTYLSGGSDRFALGAAWTSDGSALIGAATIGGVNGLYMVAADGSGRTAFLNIAQPGDQVAYVGSVLGTPFPRLTVFSTVTNTVIVSWPSPSTGWNLQQNTNLTGTNWVAPTENVSDTGTNRFIIVNPPAGSRFYRLISP